MCLSKQIDFNYRSEMFFSYSNLVTEFSDSDLNPKLYSKYIDIYE